MMDNKHQYDKSNIFESAPTFDQPDFFGGKLGKRIDLTLEGKIPSEMKPVDCSFLLEIEETLGYERSEKIKEEDTASFIKNFSINYYTTYLN